MSFIYKKGLSTLEIIVVLAVLGIILAVVLPQFSKSREAQVLNAATGDMLSALNQARTQTLASLDSSSYGVHFEDDQVIIFKGTGYTSGASDNILIPMLSPASITNITLGGVSGSSGSLYFSRLSGNPSKFGTITIETPSYSKTITITATGSASAQ